MTKCTRPTTLHAVMAHSAGMPVTKRELDALKASPASSQTPAVRGLLEAMAKVKDRPLTDKEAAGLKKMRVKQAEASRRSPARVQAPTATISDVSVQEGHPRLSGRVSFDRPPFEERTVGYYRRGIRRFERWAKRADRLGLDKGKPPAHVAQKALDAVHMVEREGKNAQ